VKHPSPATVAQLNAFDEIADGQSAIKFNNRNKVTLALPDNFVNNGGYTEEF
jgi:hypothetical protein